MLFLEVLYSAYVAKYSVVRDRWLSLQINARAALSQSYENPRVGHRSCDESVCKWKSTKRKHSETHHELKRGEDGRRNNYNHVAEVEVFWSDFKKIEMRTNNRNETIDRHGLNEQNRAVNSDVFHYYREIPSVGGGLSPNAHLSLIRASAGQTTMPTNRSTAEMNIKNTEKCFSEATKGISVQCHQSHTIRNWYGKWK